MGLSSKPFSMLVPMPLSPSRCLAERKNFVPSSIASSNAVVGRNEEEERRPRRTWGLSRALRVARLIQVHQFHVETQKQATTGSPRLICESLADFVRTESNAHSLLKLTIPLFKEMFVVFEALESDTILQHLGLGSTISLYGPGDHQGYVQLNRSLPRMHGLRRLDVDWSSGDIFSRQTPCFSAAVKACPSLRELVVTSRNWVTEQKERQELCFLTRHRYIRDVVESFQRNPVQGSLMSFWLHVLNMFLAFDDGEHLPELSGGYQMLALEKDYKIGPSLVYSALHKVPALLVRARGYLKRRRPSPSSRLKFSS